VEWLVADLTRLDGLVCGPSPFAWWKVCGTPGSGGTRYQRRDWEPLYVFCLPNRLPLPRESTNNTAFGTPPKYGPGGEFSTRTVDGSRVNDPWGKRGRGNNLGGRHPDGAKKLGTATATKKMRPRDCKRGGAAVEQQYAPPKISNPGNVIRARVGGGHLGHPLAHESEAPMPLAVAERFVCWYTPPGGIVLDPFLGSGTTIHAALLHGRRGLGCDLRQSQADLTSRRLATVQPGMF
jgi:hypothetical protein